ncbi:methyl-accepting chemotaxis protein [Halomonas sp. HG01]|uniref:methyl-accepting chemotaxis protein n=1 Tax=Halomonas sp. HG01 TaxID=1609967 RepID=UPI000A3EC6F9|nr:methyl-accepting chemotaxis protein [Halomonas sp. HG01]
MQENRILDLAYGMSDVTREKIGRIESITRQTEILALNARIEAARAGSAGAAFGVVAEQMGEVSSDIQRIARSFRDEVARQTAELQEAGTSMVDDFRGQRLTDLALNAVEIIDRNLFERSCDVRWWATDSAVVEAASAPYDAARQAHASDRLATILRSYTVYLDLWVADRDGRVIATGRPDRYPEAIGADVSSDDWFQRALRTASGDDFIVADIERNPSLEDAAVATYATAIREGGREDGAVTGVLGIFFDWAPQSRDVVQGVGLSEEERERCRVMLVDARHGIIADSLGEAALGETFPLSPEGRERGFDRDERRLVAFAETPGYETYEGLGWYGVIEYRRDAAPQAEPTREPALAAP